ncbi:hypothetical protein ABIA26_001741 [Sinorhizobium fredii]
MTAPADAAVLDLAQRSVVREAGPTVTLVPLNVPLEAEFEINARDIGGVTVDEKVRIKFDAHPFQKFGTASGSVRTISRDAFTPTAFRLVTARSERPAGPSSYFSLSAAAWLR